jgi:hypothetical protein
MAKKNSFRCPLCGRTFAMAAHLGRHSATTHAAKDRPPTRRAPGRPAKATIGRQTHDGRLRLLQELQVARADLAAQAAELNTQLMGLDEVLALLGGPARIDVAPGMRAGRRISAPGTLREHIERVLHARRGPLHVREITTAVLRAGFKSRDKALTRSVGKTLRRMPNVVKAGRGTYRTK